MRKKTVTSTSAAHKKLLFFTRVIPFFCLNLPHVRILGSFLLSKVRFLYFLLFSFINNIHAALPAVLYKIWQFAPSHRNQLVFYMLRRSRSCHSVCVVACATTIFPFKLLLSLKAKYRWKNSHFLLINDGLRLYFYIAKNVHYTLSHVQ